MDHRLGGGERADDAVDRDDRRAGAVEGVDGHAVDRGVDEVATEFFAVARELGPTGPQALLSMLAGTSLERIAEAFPGVPAVRVMPNQPVEVRRGVLCYAVGENVPGSAAV